MLIIVTEYRKGIFFVRLKGTLNKKTKYLLKKEVTELVLKHGITSLVLNLSEVNAIDLDGLAEIFNNYLIIHKMKGRAYICGINTKIDKSLKESKILSYIMELPSELNAMRVIKWIQ